MFDWLAYYIRRLFLKPFKVGIVSYYYPYSSNMNNGVALHTYYLSEKLAEFGCEVHVFTKGERNFIRNLYPGRGRLSIHFIDSRINCPIDNPAVAKRMSYFVFDNKVINEITKENSKSNFKVIHTQGWLTSGAFISKLFNNIKWVHTFHALEKRRMEFMSKDEKRYIDISKWVESTILYADALIAVSNNLRKEIIKEYPVEKERIFFIPNGVDLSLFNPENSKTNDKIVLYIGRFSLEKGIDIVVKIAEKVLLIDKEIKFVVLSPGEILPSMENIKKRCDFLSREYPKRFIFINEAKSKEELAELYRDSCIYIQPSRYESFGMCVLEAMARGNTVICSNRGGLPEVVSNAGIIIPLNSGRFASAILKLMKDHRLRERYTRRGIERAKQFSWDKIAGKTLALYKNLQKNKK